MSSQFDLFRPAPAAPAPKPKAPAKAEIPPPYRKESATSIAAADAIRKSAPTLRNRVFFAIKSAGALGMTDTELEEKLKMRLQTVVPRRNELVNLGLVVDAGFTRLTPSRRHSTVWVAKEHF